MLHVKTQKRRKSDKKRKSKECQKQFDEDPKAAEQKQAAGLLKKQKRSLRGTTKVTRSGLLLWLLLSALAPCSALGDLDAMNSSDLDALNLSPLVGSPNGSVCGAMGIHLVAAARGSGGRTWELCPENYTFPDNYTVGFMDGVWTYFGVSLLDARKTRCPVFGGTCWFYFGLFTYVCSCITCLHLGCPSRKRNPRTKGLHCPQNACHTRNNTRACRQRQRRRIVVLDARVSDDGNQARKGYVAPKAPVHLA